MENELDQRAETSNDTGVREEHLTVEIPTEIQAGLAAIEVELPPCVYPR